MSYQEFVKIINKVDVKKLKDLIAKGVDVNIQDIFGNTPLIYASSKGYFNLVKLLIEKGANPNICNKVNANALIESLINGNLQTSKILIDKTDDLNVITKSQTTALMYACEKGYIDIIKPLVEKGANINFKNSLDLSAFEFAVKSGNLELIKLLLDLGFILTQTDLDECLAFSCKKSVLNIIEFFIKKGANPNCKNSLGYPPLILNISTKADPKVIKYLIDNKADVNHIDSYSYNALMYAAFSKKNSVFKLLHSLGGNINAKNSCGSSILSLSVELNNNELVEYLCSKNVDINSICDTDGRNVLFKAIEVDNIQIVKLLLKHAIDATTPDFDNITPLNYATELKKKSISKLIMDYIYTEKTDHLVDIKCYDIFDKKYVPIRTFMKVKNNILIQDGKILYGIDKKAFINNYKKFGFIYSEKRLLPSNIKDFEKSESRYYYIRNTGLDISFIIPFEFSLEF